MKKELFKKIEEEDVDNSQPRLEAPVAGMLTHEVMC